MHQEGINTIQSTCLEITLTDENPITIQNAYPITDEEARLLTPYTFTITNTCPTTVEYDVNLDIMESNNRLNSSYIAVEFNGSEKKLLNTLESLETSYPGNEYTPVEARYLTSGELSAQTSKTYTLKLWMDESVTVEEDAMNKSFISKIVVTAKQSHIVKFVDYIMSETSKDFEVFEHPATYQTPALTDYRYTGKNPSNYVCFGSEEVPCPEDNLYRIIGVIPTQSEVNGEYENRVKLIKTTHYVETKIESGYLQISSLYPNGKGYFWDKILSNNNWTTSSLNTVLNTIYWNEIGEYQNYISLSLWHLGGAPYQIYTSITPEGIFLIERGNVQGYSKGPLNVVSNIGLICPSDYGYSLGNNYSNQIIITNANLYKKDSWLYYLGYGQWTMTPESQYYSGGEVLIWAISMNGQIGGDFRTKTRTNGEVPQMITRPTFYLKTNVLYESGKGTKENPYRISINE